MIADATGGEYFRARSQAELVRLGMAEEEAVADKDTGGAKKSLLGKFGDFKSLLPAKPGK